MGSAPGRRWLWPRDEHGVAHDDAIVHAHRGALCHATRESGRGHRQLGQLNRDAVLGTVELPRRREPGARALARVARMGQAAGTSSSAPCGTGGPWSARARSWSRATCTGWYLPSTPTHWPVPSPRWNAVGGLTSTCAEIARRRRHRRGRCRDRPSVDGDRSHGCRAVAERGDRWPLPSARAT